MRYIIYNSLIAFLMAAFIIGCSDVKENAISATQSQGLDIHPPGYARPGNPNFHGIDMKHRNWDVRQCQQCHGKDYEGGIAKVTCNNCHVNHNGPEACNTCHGNFNDPARIAPPEDLKENTDQSFAGVGLHPNHLYNTTIGVAHCSGCHHTPSGGVYSPGHLGADTLSLPYGTFITYADSTAEVIFGDIARNNNPAVPVYDKTTKTCSNTYCHGSFEFSKSDAIPTNQFAYIADKMTGNSQTVSWLNPDQNSAACGSCHGLPPQGHTPSSLNNCVICHPGVVDEFGNIIDKTKHINGEKNVRGTL